MEVYDKILPLINAILYKSSRYKLLCCANMGYAAKLGSSSNKATLQFVTLGTANSYNIKTLYPKIYANLTTNNFFYRIAAGSSSGYTNVTLRSTNYLHLVAYSTAPSFSYNKSTGVLTCGNGTCYARLDFSDGVGGTNSKTCTTTSYMYYLEE